MVAMAMRMSQYIWLSYHIVRNNILGKEVTELVYGPKL